VFQHCNIEIEHVSSPGTKKEPDEVEQLIEQALGEVRKEVAGMDSKEFGERKLSLMTKLKKPSRNLCKEAVKL
jgi:hypothetical protein